MNSMILMKVHRGRDVMVIIALMAMHLTWSGRAFGNEVVTIDCPSTLTCSLGVGCVQGSADFSAHPQQDGQPLNIHEEISRDGAHCECPIGWTGVECDRKFKTCGSGHKCYHGGECIEGLLDAFGNTQLFCDCEDAVDDDGNRYVGKWCEQPVIDKCNLSSLSNHDAFCVNGGLCNDDYPLKSGHLCNCMPQFTGPHCEFKSGTVPECTLDCGENGGHCHLGIEEPGEAGAPFSGDNSQYMHCVCPTGFSGGNCEVEGTTDEENTSGTSEVEGGTIDCPSTLTCSLGVGCVQGSADFSAHPQQDGQPLNIHEETSRDGAHCGCPIGWTGVECDRKFKTCGSGHKCYHGGECIEGLLDAFGNTQLFCDCEDAVDDDGNRYVGKWCEQPVVDKCSDEGTQSLLLEDAFCVNGGVCNKDYPLSSGRLCDCNPEFTGPHCEFKSGAVPLCTLDCGENGGHCHLGIEEPGETGAPFSGDNSHYMHCVCPIGFSGKKCELDEHFYNEELPDDSGGIPDISEDMADEESSAPISEKDDVVLCTIVPTTTGQPLSYCMNGGSCLREIEPGEEHPGCSCPEKLFMGPHCEINFLEESEDQLRGTSQATSPPNNEPESSSYVRTSISIVLITVGATTSLVAILLMRQQKMESTQQEITRALVNVASAAAWADQDDYNDDDASLFDDKSHASQYSFRGKEELSDSLFHPDDMKGDDSNNEGRKYSLAEERKHSSNRSVFLDIGPPMDEDGNALHDVDIGFESYVI